MDQPQFLMTTCQVGAEQALKAEFARRWPEFHAAFARPGFVTFKLPPESDLPPTLELHSIFARTCCFSLGKVQGGSTEELSQAVWRLVGDRSFAGLHVWGRDEQPAGKHGYVPGLTPDDREAGRAIRLQQPQRVLQTWVHPGVAVLDCVRVETDQWWIGFHETSGTSDCWPGGFCPITEPEYAVSRAYSKMEEALRWSGLPVRAGQHCTEIGAAPGGASQALLDRGLIVTGVDPADISPVVVQHPNFTHIKKRGADLRRREFRKSRWLMADLNVAPNYTLDTLEAIVTYPEIRIRGMLVTLKLLEWKLADEIPEYLFRIRSWGYKHIQARQLQHNRQEICVAAMLKRSEE